MVRLMTVGEGGSERVEGGKASVPRFTEPLGTRLNVRKRIMKVGAEVSLSALTLLSASGMM